MGRLGRIVGGAARERLEGGSRARSGEGAEHDDRQTGVELADFDQSGNAIHARHLDIERERSGLSSGIFCKASWPVPAVPATTMSGSAASTSASRRRITAESSTISTRIGGTLNSPRCPTGGRAEPWLLLASASCGGTAANRRRGRIRTALVACIHLEAANQFA